MSIVVSFNVNSAINNLISRKEASGEFRVRLRWRYFNVLPNRMIIQSVQTCGALYRSLPPKAIHIEVRNLVKHTLLSCLMSTPETANGTVESRAD